MIAYIVKLVKDLSKHWTASRAQKIDAIESRLSSTRMSILDGLNNRLSSIERALNGKVNQVSIENLTKKVDGVISAIASKASQTSLDSLKKIVEDLSSRLTSTRAQKLDNLDTTVSSRADQTTASSILSKVNQGMVKRVQRGLIIDTDLQRPYELPGTKPLNGRIYYRDITLPYSLSNINKAIAIIEVDSTNIINYGTRYIPQILNTNTLRIIFRAGTSGAQSTDLVIWWQVIEYY